MPGKGTVIKKIYMVLYIGHNVKVANMKLERVFVSVDIVWIIY